MTGLTAERLAGGGGGGGGGGAGGVGGGGGGGGGGGWGGVWGGGGARALLALVMVLVFGCVFNANGAFFRWGTHAGALRQASVYGLLATGMTLVIITGGIDLSVGSVL